MVKICPVSAKNTNEIVSRMNAFFTVLFVAAYFFTGSLVYLVVLLFDFLLRNIYEGRLSPVIYLNRYMASVLSLDGRMINAGPKIFAARVGLILSVLALVFGITSGVGTAMVPVAILGLFSFLEVAFGYCVACKIYPYVLPLNEKLERMFR